MAALASPASSTVDVIVLHAGDAYRGDRRQSEGIADSLQAQLAAQGIDSRRKEADLHDPKAAADIVHGLMQPHAAPPIVIAANDYGLDTLSALKSYGEEFGFDFKAAWSSHQVPEKDADGKGSDLLEQLHNIDLVSLPGHAVSDTLRQACREGRLVETPGVAHDITPQSLDQALAASPLHLPESPNGYSMVFLGGDAPDTGGNIHALTAQSAMELADDIIAHEKHSNRQIVITNGPRTSPEALQALTATLAEQGMHPVVYDFHAGRAGEHSAYLPMLATAAHDEQSNVYVTGDSTSMVTEIGDFIAPDKIHVARVSSMNATHHAQIDAFEALQSQAAGQEPPMRSRAAVQTAEPLARDTVSQLAAQYQDMVVDRSRLQEGGAIGVVS